MIPEEKTQKIREALCQAEISLTAIGICEGSPLHKRINDALEELAFISENSFIMSSMPSEEEIENIALNYLSESNCGKDEYLLKLEAFKGATEWWFEHGKFNQQKQGK